MCLSLLHRKCPVKNNKDDKNLNAISFEDVCILFRESSSYYEDETLYCQIVAYDDKEIPLLELVNTESRARTAEYAITTMTKLLRGKAELPSVARFVLQFIPRKEITIKHRQIIIWEKLVDLDCFLHDD